MDTSGLSAVNTASEMLTWLADNCLTPVSPRMTGSDLGLILQKMVEVGGSGTDIAAYLQSLPGYVGDGSKVLTDDLTWRTGPVALLPVPVLSLGTIVANNIPLSWASVGSSVVYVLERALDNAFTNAAVVAYSGSNLSFTDTGLDFSTSYFYRIKATLTGHADSAWSETVSATTGAGSGLQHIDFPSAGTNGPLTFEANDVINGPNGNNLATALHVVPAGTPFEIRVSGSATENGGEVRVALAGYDMVSIQWAFGSSTQGDFNARIKLGDNNNGYYGDHNHTYTALPIGRIRGNGTTIFVEQTQDNEATWIPIAAAPQDTPQPDIDLSISVFFYGAGEAVRNVLSTPLV